MSHDRSASSSDLDFARRIAQRLAAHARDGRGAQPPSREAGGYIRFSARAFQPAAATSQPDDLPWEAFGVESWHHVLDRCIDLTGADAAFVLDDHGLVIATRAEVSAETAQQLGARLQAMLDQAEQMAGAEGARGTVSMEYGERYLSGLRADRGGVAFILGLIAADPVRREARAMLERILGSAAT